MTTSEASKEPSGSGTPSGEQKIKKPEAWEPHLIQPAETSGQGRQTNIFNPYDDPTSGGLVDRTFSSCCPPDIQPNTRVVALCGITDETLSPDEPYIEISSEEVKQPKPKQKTQLKQIVLKSRDMLSSSRREKRKEFEATQKPKPAQRGKAAPDVDGWFFSDFFLFHHLFRGLGAHQIWITCESPDRLVTKYGEYAHGEPNDCRVVLDRSRIPQLRADNNIRKFERSELLVDFLRTFEGECKMAAENNQSVLLLVFGHGDEGTFGVTIGGKGEETRAPRLSIRHLIGILRGLNVSVTLFMTSCFSGGWLCRPELNVTAATAAGPLNESLAWRGTVGGRAHGSIWATAVMLALTKFEDELLTQKHPYPTERLEIETVKTSSTFANLAEVIHDTLLLKHDEGAPFSNIRFAAQDDAWSNEWRQRSGVPLEAFHERWLALRQLPSRQVAGTSIVATGGRAFGVPAVHLDNKGEYGLKKGISQKQARSIIQDLCIMYLSSFPGSDQRSTNVAFHASVRKFINGKPMTDGQIEELQHTLSYRIGLMKIGSDYKSYLDFDFVDCHKFDYEGWEQAILSEGKGKGSPEDNKRWRFAESCRARIMNADLFPGPVGKQGHSYMKPSRYFAVVLTELKGPDMEAVDDAIARLIKLKEDHVQTLMARIKDDMTVRNAAKKAFSTLGKRLRSPSPHKRGPIPSFSEVITT